jgi:CRP-like cAMP-binding protein
MVKGFREHEVPAGVQVVKEGDINDTFLVVKSGQLKVQSGDKTVRTLEAGKVNFHSSFSELPDC